MPAHLLVERALALVPEGEEFLPLSDAVIGSSVADGDKRWARSGAYATIGKRVVDSARLVEQIPALVERAQRRLQELFTLIVQAIQHQQSGNLAAAVEMLIRAGELEESNRCLDKAEKLYQLALEIARDLKDKGPQVLALRRLGRTMRSVGRLQEAWQWYEQSFQLSGDEMDGEGQVIACQGLGNICGDRGERDRARTWYDRGLKLARGNDDPSLLWPFFINFSLLARMSGDLEEAESCLVKAREHIEKAGGGSAMLFWYNSKGLLLIERDDAAGAEAVYREGLASTPDPFWELTLRVNLGQALLAQGRLFEADEQARKAEEVGVLHRLITDLVDVYDLLGSIARARCDEDGFIFYEQALQVCRERSMPPVKEAAIFHGYGLLHHSCGRVPEATAYLEQALEIYRSLGLAREQARVETDLGMVQCEHAKQEA
jgi:tetratricopeptide (TPR) repeat protein